MVGCGSTSQPNPVLHQWDARSGENWKAYLNGYDHGWIAACEKWGTLGSFCKTAIPDPGGIVYVVPNVPPRDPWGEGFRDGWGMACNSGHAVGHCGLIPNITRIARPPRYQ